LYIVYIRPILEYASEVWNNCSLIDCDKIEKVQLHAARMCHWVNDSSITNLTISWNGLGTIEKKNK